MSRGGMVRTVNDLEGVLRSMAKISPNAVDLSCWDGALRTLGLAQWALEDDVVPRKTLATKLLTFPLTLAKNLGGMQPRKKDDQLAVAVLGARAEATLPRLYWEQLGRVTDKRWHLYFVGPQAREALPGFAGAADGGIGFTVHQGYFHDAVNVSLPSLHSFDAFVLFNSGVGHPKEGKTWEATIELLKGTEKPGLFSSFNQVDLDRDLLALKSLDVDVERVDRENPLRSLASEPRGLEESPVYFNYSSIVVNFN